MDVKSLVENCYKALPSEMRYRPWDYTNHGCKVLANEQELDAYMVAYGEMHVLKCQEALHNFPFEDLNLCDYEIFDWGCGQGIATLTLLGMLCDRDMLYRLKRVTLVEPSLPAIHRAKQWAEQLVDHSVEIVAVNKFIPSKEEDKLDEVICKTKVSINLMSNILDIRSLSLKWLAEKTSSLASINYMVCVGPKFCQGANTRISDFCGYFGQPNYFSAISAYPYAYTSTTHYPYGCETRCFKHKRGIDINGIYKECADEEYFADDYDYAANCTSSKFRIDPIQKCKNIDPECRVTRTIPQTPFHGPESDAFLRAKFRCIEQNMAGTPYRIVDVQSKPYMEIYKVQTPAGIDRYDIHYKAGGIFLPAKTASVNAHTSQVMLMLDDEKDYPYVFDYHSSDVLHVQLYNLIKSTCDMLSIQMTNVVEHQTDYSVVFYMRTCGAFSLIKVYINSNGFITYAKPMSMKGPDDNELQALINELNHKLMK